MILHLICHVTSSKQYERPKRISGSQVPGAGVDPLIVANNDPTVHFSKVVVETGT